MYEGFLPVVLSLIAGVLFAFGTQFLSLGLRHGDPQTGTLIDIGTSVLFYWLLAPFFVSWSYWLTTGTLIFAVLGLFRPVLSANLAARGVNHLGPTLASTLTSTAPLFGIGYGVLLLGEMLTLPVAIGTAAIMAGLIVLAPRGGAKPAWPLWALAFPLAAALIRSSSHAFTKIGLDIVPSPFFAGMVSYSVSFALALAAQRMRRQATPISWQSPGLLWFAAAGIAHALAVVTMNTALKHGDIILVIPIVSAYPIFTLGLSLAVFRNEVLNRRTIAAMLLVLPGVMLIGLIR